MMGRTYENELPIPELCGEIVGIKLFRGGYLVIEDEAGWLVFHEAMGLIRYRELDQVEKLVND